MLGIAIAFAIVVATAIAIAVGIGVVIAIAFLSSAPARPDIVSTLRRSWVSMLCWRLFAHVLNPWVVGQIQARGWTLTLRYLLLGDADLVIDKAEFLDMVAQAY